MAVHSHGTAILEELAATRSGGVCFLLDGEGGQLTAKGCTLADGLGAAVACSGGKGTLIKCTIERSLGTAAHVSGAESQLTLKSCSILESGTDCAVADAAGSLRLQQCSLKGSKAGSGAVADGRQAGDRRRLDCGHPAQRVSLRGLAVASPAMAPRSRAVQPRAACW